MIDETIIKNKISEITNLLDAELDENSDSLFDQITCGDNWDNHNVLMKAMDKQPILYAQWAYLLKSLKHERNKIQAQLDVWTSNKKEAIAEQIYDTNIEGGMTPNNAKPTGGVVDNAFKIKYMEVDDEGDWVDEDYGEFQELLEKYDLKIMKVEIIVEAFKQRKDMLITMGSLLKGVIDNQLYINKSKFKRKSD